LFEGDQSQSIIVEFRLPAVHFQHVVKHFFQTRIGFHFVHDTGEGRHLLSPVGCGRIWHKDELIVTQHRLYPA
jgi:hypothetical protein